jgi:hypothetical protein
MMRIEMLARIKTTHVFTLLMGTVDSSRLVIVYVVMYLAVVANVAFGVTDEHNSSFGRVRGSVSRIMGDHTVPVGKVKLTFSGIEGTEFETTTDTEGRYELDLPSDSYRVLLHWYGDCSEIHRAPFRLGKGDYLTFDFLLVSCQIVDTEKDAPPSTTVTGDSEAAMSIPLSKQAPGYREQVIPAGGHGRPEILVSFGKYDNQADHIEYFCLQNQRIKNLSSRPFSPMPLPVTVTVDRYTIRASRVLWYKKTMTFHATGDVSISDGHVTVKASSAVLSFPRGVPKVLADPKK